MLSAALPLPRDVTRAGRLGGPRCNHPVKFAFNPFQHCW
jgi:hypothetical protein